MKKNINRFTSVLLVTAISFSSMAPILSSVIYTANAETPTNTITIPTPPVAPTPPTPPTFGNTGTSTATTTIPVTPPATTTSATTTTATSTATTSMVKVIIDKFVNGTHATASSSNSQSFQMFTTYNSTTTGSGSGNYDLSPLGYAGNPTPYQAMTVPMESGASYATNEVIGGNVVLSCATGTNATNTFALAGYSWGDTYAQAMAATHSSSSPSFTNIMNDKYVIVWNTACWNNNTNGGQIGGEVTGGATSTIGVLHVDSIDNVNATGTADGTFEGGWKYGFNITIPTNETHVAMKFADWMNTTGSATMPVANNLRISSMQADNSNATVMITAANTYTTPWLNMLTDLNPSMIGMQVRILVESMIPVNSLNGSYTTNYGIKTQ